ITCSSARSTARPRPGTARSGTGPKATSKLTAPAAATAPRDQPPPASTTRSTPPTRSSTGATRTPTSTPSSPVRPGRRASACSRAEPARAVLAGYGAPPESPPYRPPGADPGHRDPGDHGQRRPGDGVEEVVVAGNHDDQDGHQRIGHDQGAQDPRPDHRPQSQRAPD